MKILKCALILILAVPAIANNVDDEIIKNLDFFQNMDLVKDGNPIDYNKTLKIGASDDQFNLQTNSLLESDDVTVEKKQ